MMLLGGDGVDPCCVLLLVLRMHDGLTMMMRGGHHGAIADPC